MLSTRVLEVGSTMNPTTQIEPTTGSPPTATVSSVLVRCCSI